MGENCELLSELTSSEEDCWNLDTRDKQVDCLLKHCNVLCRTIYNWGVKIGSNCDEITNEYDHCRLIKCNQLKSTNEETIRKFVWQPIMDSLMLENGNEENVTQVTEPRNETITNESKSEFIAQRLMISGGILVIIVIFSLLLYFYMSKRHRSRQNKDPKSANKKGNFGISAENTLSSNEMVEGSLKNMKAKSRQSKSTG